MSTVYSFGYKVGEGEHQFATTGPCAPLILDCRGVDNPHSDPYLRALTGRSVAVQRAVRNDPIAKRLLARAFEYLVDNPTGYVAFGCSYGRHRSVALAEILAKRLVDKPMIVHTANYRSTKER